MPNPDCNISPAIIVFGQPIQDAFAFINRLEKFSNKHVPSIWKDVWEKKEEALHEGFHKSAGQLNEHAKELPKLSFRDRCYIQNQTGNHPKHWDCSGIVMEIFQNDSSGIKINGTGHITCQNRQFLLNFTPALPVITYQPSTTSSPTSRSIVYNVKTSNTANPLQTASKMNMCSDNRSNVLSNTPPPVAEAHNNILLSDIASQQSQQHKPDVAPTDDSMCLPTENTVPSDNVAIFNCPKCLQQAPKRYEPETGTWL